MPPAPIRATILSHFDALQGPSVVATVPALDVGGTPMLEAVAKLIDVVEEEHFFVTTIQGVFTANYFFKIDDPTMRGKTRLLLLSIALEASGLDDKDRALRFLNGTESLLAGAARRVQRHDGFISKGLLHGDNLADLKDVLHQVHEDAFHGLRATLIDDGGGARGKIAVFGPRGVDVKPVIDEFLEALATDPGMDLRSRLVLKTTRELVFLEFTCKERGTSTCWNDRCPGCMGLAVESDAAMFVYERAGFSKADEQDLVMYLKSIHEAKDIPVILLEVVPAPGGAPDGATGRVGPVEVARKAGTGLRISHHVVPRGDVASFKDALAALVKLII